MSIYSCNISNVSRAKGSSSCATLSYISAEKVREDRTGSLFQYGRGERVVDVQTILPENAPIEYRDAKKLFNAIENYETASNARTAKKVMVALPREFDLPKQKTVLAEYIKETVTAQGYACAYAIHADKDNNNPHAHILIANRPLNEKGEWSTKSRKEYAIDEKGERIPQLDENGNQKLGKRNEKLWKRVNAEVNPLDKKETLQKLREQWSVVCNKHLAPERQIDHRSLADQGKDVEPTIHEGHVARKIEAKGGVSEICERNREIDKRNNLLIELRLSIEKIQKVVSEFFQRREQSNVRKQQEPTLPKRTNNDIDAAAAELIRYRNDFIKARVESAESTSFVPNTTYERKALELERLSKTIFAQTRSIEGLREEIENVGFFHKKQKDLLFGKVSELEKLRRENIQKVGELGVSLPFVINPYGWFSRTDLVSLDLTIKESLELYKALSAEERMREKQALFNRDASKRAEAAKNAFLSRVEEIPSEKRQDVLNRILKGRSGGGEMKYYKAEIEASRVLDSALQNRGTQDRSTFRENERGSGRGR